MLTAKGLMEILVPKGEHSVFVGFKDTTVRKIAGIISIFSFILLFTLFIRKWYIKNK